MFVINANGQNSGYSCVEINNNYTPPMDGSVYSMYGGGAKSQDTFCACARKIAYPSETQTCYITHTCDGWNGCCSNSSSLLEYAKVNSFDNEIFFPNNINCEGSFGPFNVCRGIDFNMDITCSQCCVIEFDYTLPENLFYSLASKKQFPAGICIGKKINGYLGVLVSDKTFSNNCLSSCRNFVYKSSPIEFYVGYGLLHTDGTIDYLFCCDFKTSGGCRDGETHIAGIDTQGDFGVVSETCGVGGRCYLMSDPNNNLIYGEKTTCGLTTQEGDRLILRMGNKESCGKFYGYSRTNCGTTSNDYFRTWVGLYGGTQYCYGRQTCGPCYFVDKSPTSIYNCCMYSITYTTRGSSGLCNSCYSCSMPYQNSELYRVVECSPDRCRRFGGIQFSIE